MIPENAMRTISMTVVLLLLVGCASTPEPAVEPTTPPEPEPPLVRELPHLESTPPELRAEIDRLAVTLVDFYAGSSAVEAQDRLIEIGHPALPKVLSAFLHTGPWEDREGMINACFVSETLRRMVPEDVSGPIPRLKPFAIPSADEVRAVVVLWFRWWEEQR